MRKTTKNANWVRSMGRRAGIERVVVSTTMATSRFAVAKFLSVIITKAAITLNRRSYARLDVEEHVVY